MNALSTRSITPRTFAFDLGIMLFVATPIFLRVHQLDRIGPLDVAALAASVGLLTLRRSAAIPALAIGLAATVVVSAIAERPTVLIPAAIVLLFEVSVRRDRRTAFIAGAATLATFFVIIGLVARERFAAPEALAAVAWPALAVAAGDVLRQRRLTIETTIAEADARIRIAEASRAEEVRRHVAEERLRIARELHDVVAHRMAVVNVQAGVAAHLVRTRPDEAEEALAIVRSSARTVLDELAGILNVLRTADDPAAPVEPAPQLGDLPALVASFHDAGLEVVWETSGAPAPLAPSVEAALYRTAQEALTNAHKHGDGKAHLSIAHTDHGVELTVTNRSTHLESTQRGFGLVGMRERVLAAGGTLLAEPRGDEFRVEAHLPAGGPA